MTWQEQAACRGHEHPEWWFPSKDDAWKVKLAKEICAGCPVKLECRAAGMAESDGVWGGLSERDRTRARGKTAKPCEICGLPFEGRTCDKYCSPACQRLGFRIYQREYQRARTDRVNGTKLREGHGTISKYHSGCRCPACRAVSRERRNLARKRAS